MSEIVARIHAGTFSRQDIKLLLIELRDHAHPHNPLRDIADFIHPVRDRGVALEHFNELVSVFLDAARNGGAFVSQGAYSKQRIIDELIDILDALGIDADVKVFQKNAEKISEYITEYLDGTAFDIKHDSVSSCSLSVRPDNNQLVFCFTINKDLEGALRIQAGQVFSLPFFTDDLA